MDDKEFLNREEEHDVLFGVINRFIGYFTRQAVPKTINDTTREYPFVAMDTRQAYNQLLLARSFLLGVQPTASPLSFIDIGCGIGNILLLAEMLDFAVFGIEKDTASLEIAQSLLDESRVSQEDIWSFEGLSDFDVIYYFRPFCEKKSQVTFEKHVEDQLKIGGILIANRKMDTDIEQDSCFRRIDSQMPVWVKLS